VIRCVSLLVCPVCAGTVTAGDAGAAVTAGDAGSAVTAGDAGSAVTAGDAGAAITAGDAGAALRCARGHSFDRARAGYYDLLAPGHGRTSITGDVRPMVEARRRFLSRGHYDRIAAAVNAAALHVARGVVLDVGCGEGWYLGRLLAAHATPAETCFIGLDISRDALRLAARTHRDALFIVNDVGHRLCVADASVDVLLNIFAPRNETEFARVLRPGGSLVVVVPAEDHLRELRERYPLLSVEASKVERTLARFAGAFSVEGQEELRYTASLSADDASDAVRMGPSYWHLPEDFAGDAASATVDVRVLILRRR
jgi:23S rRNA (guanine745-N1)-methyltransferase